MTKHDEVMKFISRFTSGDKKAAVEECFTCGCCYWFAHILKYRFQGEIVYDEIENHFGCKIGDIVYDITGDVTAKYKWITWFQLLIRDDLLYRRILRDCVNF